MGCARQNGMIASHMCGLYILEALEFGKIYRLNNNCLGEDDVSPIEVFFNSAAKQTRMVTLDFSDNWTGVVLGGQYMRSWEAIITYGFERRSIPEALEVERSKKYSYSKEVNLFMVAQRRIELGWWDDAKHDAAWLWRSERGCYGRRRDDTM